MYPQSIVTRSPSACDNRYGLVRPPPVSLPFPTANRFHLTLVGTALRTIRSQTGMRISPGTTAGTESRALLNPSSLRSSCPRLLSHWPTGQLINRSTNSALFWSTGPPSLCASYVSRLPTCHRASVPPRAPSAHAHLSPCQLTPSRAWRVFHLCTFAPLHIHHSACPR